MPENIIFCYFVIILTSFSCTKVAMNTYNFRNEQYSLKRRSAIVRISCFFTIFPTDFNMIKIKA